MTSSADLQRLWSEGGELTLLQSYTLPSPHSHYTLIEYKGFV